MIVSMKADATDDDDGLNYVSETPGIYVKGKPRGLKQNIEEHLEKGSLGFKNISERELITNVVGFETETSDTESNAIKINGITRVKKTRHPLTYFFFEPQENSVLMDAGYRLRLRVPLSRDNYGFGNQEMSIDPEKIEDLKLSEEEEKVYNKLLGKKQVRIEELLEKVGGMINHSMTYDFDGFKATKIEHMANYNFAVLKWADIRENYKPNKNEVTKGICVDAGKEIRRVLGSLGIEEKFAYCRQGAGYQTTFDTRKVKGLYELLGEESVTIYNLHDVTVLFDKESGKWGVINSKSPTKKYNFVPKTKLKELGNPFYKSEDNLRSTFIPEGRLPAVKKMAEEYLKSKQN